jgi:hypothetical protein
MATARQVPGDAAASPDVELALNRTWRPQVRFGGDAVPVTHTGNGRGRRYYCGAVVAFHQRVPAVGKLHRHSITRCPRPPQLSITGAAGLPTLQGAGNVLRPFTTITMSMRIPPTVVSACAHSTVSQWPTGWSGMARMVGADAGLRARGGACGGGGAMWARQHRPGPGARGSRPQGHPGEGPAAGHARGAPACLYSCFRRGGRHILAPAADPLSPPPPAPQRTRARASNACGRGR